MKKSLKLNKIKIISLLVLIISSLSFMVSIIVEIKSDINLEIKKDYQTIYSRNDKLLNKVFTDELNSHDLLKLQDIPKDIVNNFIYLEDKNFYTHNGVDWSARFTALYQNIKNFKIVRGASTITEQTVRIITPRQRSIKSKLIETIEAYYLESKYTKDEILQYYLNQAPYSSNRRGIKQAAHYYFNRTIYTLNFKEKVALTVLLQAPSIYSPYKSPGLLNKKVNSTLIQMKESGFISNTQYNKSKSLPIEIGRKPFNNNFFALKKYIKSVTNKKRVKTTIDFNLQRSVTKIINHKITSLKSKEVNNAAILIADHTTGEILSYVAAGQEDFINESSFYDPIQIPRQPASTIKPFLYGKYIDEGNSHIRTITDGEISEKVNLGIHRFKNYSNMFYGEITLREALANSLNTPAIRIIDELGVDKLFYFLKELKMKNINKTPEFYGNGLALGNLEITLFDLVQAYTVFANNGKLKTLRIRSENKTENYDNFKIKPTTAYIINDILSDPSAREIEFGISSQYDFKYQTAIKTGTSTDYKDAWAIGYNSKYIIGIWMGNIDNTPMQKVSGSNGPGTLMQPLFSELNKLGKAREFKAPKGIVSKTVCIDQSTITLNCSKGNKYLEVGTLEHFSHVQQKNKTKNNSSYLITFPKDNIIFAIDPRTPIEDQIIKFEMDLNENLNNESIVWNLNGKDLIDNKMILKKGKHTLISKVYINNEMKWKSKPITFTVIE